MILSELYTQAARDLESAEKLYQAQNHENSVLMSYACAEKCIKGCIEMCGEPAPHIHDLVELGNTFKSLGGSSYYRSTSYLSRYYTMLRYPEDGVVATASEEEALNAIEHARFIYSESLYWAESPLRQARLKDRPGIIFRE